MCVPLFFLLVFLLSHVRSLVFSVPFILTLHLCGERDHIYHAPSCLDLLLLLILRSHRGVLYCRQHAPSSPSCTSRKSRNCTSAASALSASATQGRKQAETRRGACTADTARRRCANVTISDHCQSAHADGSARQRGGCSAVGASAKARGAECARRGREHDARERGARAAGEAGPARWTRRLAPPG